jgi:NAD(P)H-dependent FMN reductase
MIPASKFIWILPEYNGSFPGILKLFIDVLSVRKKEETFSHKKSMLIGIATGRSGNILGMDHFAGILIHLRSLIFPRLLPISRVSDLMDDKGLIIHEPTLRVLKDHLQEFSAF